MPSLKLVAVASVISMLGARFARADEPEPVAPPEAPSTPPSEPPPPEPPPPEPPPSAPAPTAPTPEELAARIDELEDAQQKLEAQQRRNAGLRDQVKSLLPLTRFITVFADVGAFVVGGDGAGIRSDLDHVYYPQFRNLVPGQWVFMGDPLSTAINSLGEPADSSDSRELPPSSETLHAGDHPSGIVNSLGLSIGKDVGHGFGVSGLTEFLPRPGGDQLDVELAYVSYRPSDEVDFVISAGKIDSVLGVEYRNQDAPRRLDVTPSLICRYTCGRPIGVEARLVSGSLSASASVADRDSFDARFEASNELHPNALPTGSAHLQWMLPVGQGLELGVSGMVGPQTNQPYLDIVQWHVGFDLRLHDLYGFDFTAEYVKGDQPGRTATMTPCDIVECLNYQGAYAMIDRHVNSWFVPYARVDWRSAVAEDGVQFVYESHVLRATVGTHFEVTSRIVAKLEYTFNTELQGPQFPHDVVTTSLVISTD
jgi:hypothetical protein